MNRFLNKCKAKIQLFPVVLAMLLANSCERKDLFLRVDSTNISIAIYDINLELLWGIDWQTEWQYEWDEALGDYGSLGYTRPDQIRGTIYNVNSATKKRYSSFTHFFNANGGRISLNAGSLYDMMFYNAGTEYINFYQDEDYEYYNGYTRASSNVSWVRTRSEDEFSVMPDTTRTYIDYNQPDELFGTLVEDLQVSEDPTEYRQEIDPVTGNIIYVCDIDATLRPYTFIYLYQFIILHNDDSKGMRIKGAYGYTVTGLAQGVDLYSRKNFSNTISISSSEDERKTMVKQLQRHFDVKVPGGEVADTADIMAARLLTWGLPGIVPLDYAEGKEAPNYDNNYIGIGFKLRNNQTWRVTLDITEQMHKHPTGGVITIVIDANQVPQSLLDKETTNTGGGFNATVENWQNEINAEITI